MTVVSAPVDDLGAFVPGGRLELAPTASGPLQGLRFAVKDLIDVEGKPTGAGNPTWARDAAPATRDASVVRRLRAAGATVVGKTILDELAFGIAGTSHHYGSPTNVVAPDRFAGGSSCGSAAAVAGGLADFALGTDTGGSVRIPASYCGIAGIRPTHGRMPLDGIVQLASSFDTAGWMAADAEALLRVAAVVLRPDEAPRIVDKLILVAEDAIEETDAETRAALREPMRELERSDDTAIGTIRLAGPAGDLETLGATYRSISGWEAWHSHREWIEAHPDALGPAAAERFAVASRTTQGDADDAYAFARTYASWLAASLAEGTVIWMPTTPGPAPRKDSDPQSLASGRLETLRLTAAASLGRVPEVSLPLLTVSKAPVGVSLIGARGTDTELLRFATMLAGARKGPTDDD